MAENVNINSNSIFQETKELLSNLVDGIVAESESFIKIGGKFVDDLTVIYSFTKSTMQKYNRFQYNFLIRICLYWY